MITVNIGNTKTIWGYSFEEKNRIKDDLTIANPMYAKAKKYAKYVGRNFPKYLTYYQEAGGEMVVPAYYEIPFENEIKEDSREEVTVKYPPFLLQMRETQQQALNAYLDNPEKGIIVIPTGKGKTILGLKIASVLKQKLLVIVHKDDLVHGWQEDIKLCFGDKLSPGLIKARKRIIGEQITIATIQTLSRLSDMEWSEIEEEFGMIIIDECFPAGTKVDGKNIEDIKVGDFVKSFNETTKEIELKRVIRTFKSVPKVLVKIVLSNGKEVSCTAGHPFYVNGEYIPAIQLKKDDELYCMPEGSFESNQKQSKLLQTNRKNLLLLRMFSGLQEKSFFRKYAESKFQICKREDEEKQSYAERRISTEDDKISKRKSLSWWREGWKWKTITSTSKTIAGFFERLFSGTRVCCENFAEEGVWIPLPLQDRYSDTPFNDSNRSGRIIPQFSFKKRTGFEERLFANRLRVVSVTIQESTSDGTFGGMCSDSFVYNIEVEDNNNYFAEGLLVHNCHHTPAESYNVINEFFAPYKIGLSATPERADGLSKLMQFYLGGICYQYKFVDDDEDILPVEVVIREVPIEYEPTVIYEGEEMPVSCVPFEDRPNIPFSFIETQVLMNNRYMETVLTDVLREVNDNRSVLLFLTQKEHCRAYFDALVAKGISAEKMQMFYGDATESNALLKEKAETGEAQVTIATLAKASEGTNVKAWEVAFLVTSMNDGKNVEQAIGRIRRAREGKLNPVRVYDYRLPKVYILKNHGFNRDKRYRQLGFQLSRAKGLVMTRGSKI